METETTDPITGEATTKTEAGGSATETVASDGAQDQKTNAGGSQEQTEGGKDDGTEQAKSKFVSKQQQLYELRQKLRERDSQIEQLNERFSQFERKLQERTQEQKPSRTFWEAPEDTIKEMMEENRKALLTEFNQTRLQDQEGVAWKQETSEAAKFIQSQKGMTQDDHIEIAELIRSTPAMANMRPMERAEYATFLWQKSHGIGDRSAAKARAATVTGSPGTSTGKRNAADVEKDILSLPKDMKKWSPEDHKRYDALEKEIMGMQPQSGE